jgi:hypothetical protein
MKLLKKEMLFGVEYDPLLVEMTRILKDYQQISKNCHDLVNEKTEQFFQGKFELCSLEIKQRYLELAALVSAKGAEADEGGACREEEGERSHHHRSSG